MKKKLIALFAGIIAFTGLLTITHNEPVNASTHELPSSIRGNWWNLGRKNRFNKHSFYSYAGGVRNYFWKINSVKKVSKNKYKTTGIYSPGVADSYSARATFNKISKDKLKVTINYDDQNLDNGKINDANHYEPFKRGTVERWTVYRGQKSIKYIKAFKKMVKMQHGKGELYSISH